MTWVVTLESGQHHNQALEASADCDEPPTNDFCKPEPRVHSFGGDIPRLEVEEDDTEFDERGSVNLSMCILVMLETLCDSVWVYATSGKGYASDPWLPKKLHNDLVTVGMGNIRIIVKSDTVASIIDMRKETIKCRGDAPTGCEDSRVGDPNSNGKIGAHHPRGEGTDTHVAS